MMKKNAFHLLCFIASACAGPAAPPDRGPVQRLCVGGREILIDGGTIEPATYAICECACPHPSRVEGPNCPGNEGRCCPCSAVHPGQLGPNDLLVDGPCNTDDECITVSDGCCECAGYQGRMPGTLACPGMAILRTYASRWNAMIDQMCDAGCRYRPPEQAACYLGGCSR